MQPKFRHEAHNRQDKAAKRDYRADMLPRDSSQGLPPEVASGSTDADIRSGALKRARRFRFVIRGFSIRPSSKLADFAKANSLDPLVPDTAQLFAELHELVVADLECIEAAIRTSEIRRVTRAFRVLQVSAPKMDWWVSDGFLACSAVFDGHEGVYPKDQGQIAPAGSARPAVIDDPLTPELKARKTGPCQYEVEWPNSSRGWITLQTEFECPLCRQPVTVRTRGVSRLSTEEEQRVHRVACSAHHAMEHPELR